MKKLLFGACMLIGLGLVTGSAGASDACALNIILAQMVAGVVLTVAGGIGLQATGVKVFE